VIGEVRIIDGEWVALTDWYEPHQKPVRSGLFEGRIFDCGWQYEWTVFWCHERGAWLDKEGGNTLTDQNISWRGLTEQTT
jgi:hypothetical protein